MRLLLSAVDADSGRVLDLALDADPDTPVGDLAEQFAARLRVGMPVSLHAPARPGLWLGEHELAEAVPLASSPLRHGAVVGVGGPVAEVTAEPSGLVELRVVSGPGAGRVHRLGVGRYAVGAGRDCPVVLDGGQVPDVAAWVEISLDGRVAVEPAADVVGAVRTLPARRRPLPGPIVLPRGDGPAQRPRRMRLPWRRPRGVFAAGVHDEVDPELPPPLVHLGRRPLTTPQPWLQGQLLTLGSVLLQLAQPEPPDASLSPTPAGATLDYNRPPRLLAAPRRTAFSLPTEPVRPDRLPLPILMVLAPIALSLGLYLVTHSVITLLVAGFTPLMAISTYSTSSRQARSRYRSQLAQYRERRETVETRAYAALLAERRARAEELPDPAEVLLLATGPRSRLWERRRTDPDWLLLRVGTADLPSEVTLADAHRDQHDPPKAWTAPDAPVAVDLDRAAVIGVAGPAAARDALARWLVAQAAVLHSPSDLRMTVLAGPDAQARWAWVRWLPHLRSGTEAPHLLTVGGDDESGAALLAEIVALMHARTAPGGDRAVFDPVLVILDGARRLRLLPGMVSLLQDGPAVGFRFLCFDEDPRHLPEECRAVIDLAAVGTAGAGTAAGAGGREATDVLAEVAATGRSAVELVRPDLPPVAWAQRLARALAPVRDVSSEDLASSLPSSARLLDVLGLDPPSPQRVLHHWVSTGGRTTTATIGVGLDGPFSLDLRRDGPHGLIAGTTGSGKSELLQTLIASLAVGNRPDEMTFVLIDYKGGAAFQDCARLPHTVGMVTDLDGHLTARALDSLSAELRRRERQLARAGAKDIEDYLVGRDAGMLTNGRAGRLPAHDPFVDPMPRLLLVIDEFAALVGELPDFVSGLVDIARRGRSLGVHLLLATQRPAGVVSSEITSNTGLRIALRVTDAADSSDVIEAADAAAIPKSLPGRAFARLGGSTLVAFQSARVGGRARGAGRQVVTVRDVEWATLGSGSGTGTGSGQAHRGRTATGAVLDAPAPPRRATAGGDSTAREASSPTDLALLVDAVRAAAGDAAISLPPSPWLPPLPSLVTLDALPDEPSPSTTNPGTGAARLVGVDRRRGRGSPAPLRFGLADLPADQHQDVAVFDLARSGHLSVIGSPRSGRSGVLRVLAASVGRDVSPADVHVYGIDCGNNALLPLVALPHVGAVVTREQPDRVARLTERLLAEIGRRQQLLADQGYADVPEQRASAATDPDRLPYLLVLLDRWEGFTSAFDSYDGGRLLDQWAQILAEGAAVGVKVVLTCDRTGLSGRVAALVDDKLLLRLTDPLDYGAIGMSSASVPEHVPPGRGFRSGELHEVQVALLVGDPAGTAQVAALQQIAREAVARAHDVPRSARPWRVDPLPARITLPDALDLHGEDPLVPVPVGAGAALTVAVGGDTLGARLLVPAQHGPGVLVVGPRRSGRSTALLTLTGQALGAGWSVVAMTGRPGALRDGLAQLVGIDCFTPDSPRDVVTAAVRALGEAATSPLPANVSAATLSSPTLSSPTLLVVDDLDVLDQSGWFTDLVTEHLALIRDSTSLVVASGTIEDLAGSYRGPAPAIKKSRTGLVLAPATPGDGDAFGLRLPRTALGPAGPGRGILVRGGSWETVQVPLP